MSMAEMDSRQRTLLWVLLALFVVLGWRFLPGLFSREGGFVGIGRDNARQSQVMATLELVQPKLEALEAEAGQYEPGRNIFGYAAKAPPPPPPPKPPPTKAPTKVVRQPPPAPPPARPQPPPVTVDLLGIFGSESRRIAVLSDGTNLLNVVEEGVIDGKFIVHRIGFESVDLKFVGFPDAEPHRLVIGG